MYKFIVRQYGTTMGPYSAEDLVGLGLPDDVELMEQVVTDGEWVKLETLDLDELCEQEKLLNQQEEEEALRRRQDKRQPTCIKKWNWGAFVFSGLWGLFNGIYWPIIVQIVMTLLCRLVEADIISSVVTLIISVVLATTGNEMAWKKSKDVYWEDFDASQKRWKKIGLVGLVLGIIISLVVLADTFNFGSGSTYYDYYDSNFDDLCVDTIPIDSCYDESTYVWNDEY